MSNNQLLSRWRRALATFTMVVLAGACQSAGEAVYVVRHAEAFKNLRPLPEMPTEQLDSLTQKGLDQAQSLAAALTGRGVELVLYSPTGRTRQTATIIAEALGIEARVAPELAPLRGAWDEREAAWRAGRDLRPDNGESMADGVDRALRLVRGCSRILVVVTHGDIAAGLIGQAAGTAIQERWPRHEPATGSMTEVRLERDAQR